MGNANASTRRCPVCASSDLAPVIELLDVPIHCNLLWDTREDALAARRGDVRLCFCQVCGHLFNVAFDPALTAYSQQYENSLHFSPHFQEYANALAASLVARYDLHGKTIVDIGCGRGDFLALLCGIGGNRGFGFDPACPDTSPDPERIAFVRDFYSERYASYAADFISCRHTLEHVEDPIAFLSTIRRSIGDRHDVVIFFEVPNAEFIVRNLSAWDIFYEHPSYFWQGSLRRTFEASGFEVLDQRATFDGQYLCVDARPRTVGDTLAADGGDGLTNLRIAVDMFGKRYEDMYETWRTRLDEIFGDGRRAVVWGAGSKGVTFLNRVRVSKEIPYAVDVNPRKHGKFVAGTGQLIVEPGFLVEYQPDVVIVMNPVYADEIRQSLRGLGVSAEVVCA